MTGRLIPCAFSGVLTCVLACAPVNAATSGHEDSVQLELQPRICTLSAQDEFCDTTVRAQWKSSRDESLCLVIVGRPEVRRCWEKFSGGVYEVALTFSADLIVELRDPQLRRVLASEAISVIREALQLRRKRRQPWNILY